MGRSNLNQKVDLILYDRYMHLAEALQTIEENVFRLSLTDKKRKELIFSCPKSSTMKCLPPSVKDTASATAMRADSVLYNLQATLVNITRQIYMFVHQKLLNNLEIFPEDNDIVFVHNIRIFEPETGPLFDPKAFKALVTAKNATRKTFLRRHFQRRQQSAHQAYSFNGFAQAQQTQATASTAPYNNPATNNQKKNRRTQTGLRLEKPKPTIRRKKFQNGDITNNMSYHTQERLHDFAKSRRCIYAHSDLSVVKKIPELTCLHQKFATRIGMSKITENKYFGILGYPYYRGDKREMCALVSDGIEVQRRAIKTKGLEITPLILLFGTNDISGTYKSAILGLVKNPTEITNQRIFTEFFKTLNELLIISFIKPSINIDLIVETLIIIAPKEKRGGQPVERICQIAEHSNPIICLVMAYRKYESRVATTSCITPLSVGSITRHTHGLSGLMAHFKNTTIPNAWEIGATLIAQAGASAGNIVNHAFWYNYSIFDSYY
ncbi:hypothetical protein BB561_004538 [Smittium simulii]|uniref:Uncharacterized protein n=1 Tax=Smittium simulii TaxID=133385 RepID=A0A2T9YFR4_9FUNG|nr:hypothetical protein BB561_004538 [Smittium simulii]